MESVNGGIPTMGLRREIRIYCEESHGGGYTVPITETEDAREIADFYFITDPVAIQAVLLENGATKQVFNR